MERIEPHFDPRGVSWFTGEQLQEFELPEQRWVVKDLLTSNGRLLVYGSTGVHKSMVVLTLALTIVHGGVFLKRFPTKRGRVLYFGTSDMPLTDWQERVKKAGDQAAAQGFMLMHAEENPKVDTIDPKNPPEWLKAAREFRPNVVVIDVINETHGLDQNDVGTPGPVMEAWRRLFPAGVSFIYVHHEKKPPNDPSVREDPTYGKHAFSGAQNWQNLVGTSIRVVKNPKTSKAWIELTKVRSLPPEKANDIVFHVDPETLLVDNGDDAWARAWTFMEQGRSAEATAKLIAGKSIHLSNALDKCREIAEVMEVQARHALGEL